MVLSSTEGVSGGWGTLLGVLSNLGVVSGVVMGIGHIFKIDDHYTNTDQWSIFGEHYPLNVFTNYNYSNSLLQEYAWQM